MYHGLYALMPTCWIIDFINKFDVLVISSLDKPRLIYKLFLKYMDLFKIFFI